MWVNSSLDHKIMKRSCIQSARTFIIVREWKSLDCYETNPHLDKVGREEESFAEAFNKCFYEGLISTDDILVIIQSKMINTD